MPHRPVLVSELFECLELQPGQIVVDGTLGSGGHAEEVLKRIGPGGLLLGLDQDPEAVERCGARFLGCPNVTLRTENFINLDRVLDQVNLPRVDAVILDVGIAADQLENSARGFSFERDGPLDMRMDPRAALKARDLVNDLSQSELETIFREYGNERWSRPIARAVVDARQGHPIETTGELAKIVTNGLPQRFRMGKGRRPPWMKIHPATRVFQALRIATNDELNILGQALPRIWMKIRPGGRLAVIAFHSLEDRIVKRTFRAWADAGKAILVSKKPRTAGAEEKRANPSSRSAKLRVVEKIHEDIA